MISARYATALGALLALALVPTIIHSYADAVARDGRSAQSIPVVLAGYTSAPSNRGSGWGKHKFDSDDWFDRKYTDATSEVVMTVVRSYDLKRLYHHPELDVAYGTSLPRHEVARLPEKPDMPIHLLRSDQDVGPIAMYVLHYDQSFVRDPIAFQIRTAGQMLFSPRKPMTLLFVQERSAPRTAQIGSLRSAKLLFAAIDEFLGRRSQASN